MRTPRAFVFRLQGARSGEREIATSSIVRPASRMRYSLLRQVSTHGEHEDQLLRGLDAEPEAGVPDVHPNRVPADPEDVSGALHGAGGDVRPDRLELPGSEAAEHPIGAPYRRGMSCRDLGCRSDGTLGAGRTPNDTLGVITHDFGDRSTR